MCWSEWLLMVYILFYRIGHENNAESFTDVLIPSLVTVFVLLLFTSGLLIILVLYLKKKSSSPRGYKYRDKGNTKYQTYLSGNFTIKSQQNKNSLIEWKKKLSEWFYWRCFILFVQISRKIPKKCCRLQAWNMKTVMYSMTL